MIHYASEFFPKQLLAVRGPGGKNRYPSGFAGGAPFNFGDPYRNPCFGVSKTHSKVGGRENLPPQNTVFEQLDPRKTQCFRSSNVKNT